MNKDKIELEEAIKFLDNMRNTIKENKLFFDEDNIQVKIGIKTEQAIETLLHVVKNSIPKKKIEELIENEIINISGFECIAVEDIQELLKEEL